MQPTLALRETFIDGPWRKPADWTAAINTTTIRIRIRISIGIAASGSTTAAAWRYCNSDVNVQRTRDVGWSRVQVVDFVACANERVVKVVVQPGQFRVHVRVVHLHHRMQVPSARLLLPFILGCQDDAELQQPRAVCKHREVSPYEFTREYRDGVLK